MIDDPRLRRHRLGFWEIVKKPTSEELEAFYRDKYFQEGEGNYQNSYTDTEREYIDLKIAQRAFQVAKLRGDRKGSFLDVGCGEGFAMATFDAMGWQVEGLDYSIAGVKAMNPGLVEKVACGDVFELLEERLACESRYDLIWLNNVLEHVLDPLSLLLSLRQIVSPKGVLVVTVPNDGSGLQELLLKDGDIGERFWIAEPDHVSYFDADSLDRTLVETGWVSSTILADFPIDLYLLHPGSNYVRDSKRNGRDAHHARVRAELFLGEKGHDEVNHMYAAMPRVGLGRHLTAFATLWPSR